MSDILFDPNNISNIVPRDVLNIIGTYVQHPLCDVIKKEVVYEDDNGDTIIKFGKKRYRYYYFYWSPVNHILKYENMFKRILSIISVPKFTHQKFEIYYDPKFGAYFLKNIIPMHRDTFTMMHLQFIYMKRY